MYTESEIQIMNTETTSSGTEYNVPGGLNRLDASHDELFHDLARLAHQVSAGEEVDDAGLTSLVILSGIKPDDPRVSKLLYICRADVILSKRIDAISRRIQHLMDVAPPSKEHFEKLRSRLSRADRKPRKTARTWLIRSGTAVTGILVLLLGTSYMMSEMRPEHQKLAALQTVTSSVPELHFRSTTTSPDQLHTYYLAGIQAVHDAENGIFGLFQHFDPERLRVAQELLREVTILDPEGAVGLEAAYMLARIHLHNGDVATAREGLMYVIAHQGPSEPEALQLLQELE